MIKRLIFDIDGTLIRNVRFDEAITKSLREFHIDSKENLDKFLNAISNYEKHYDNYNKKDYLHFLSTFLQVELKEDFLKCFFKNLKDVVPKNTDEIKKTIQYLSEKYELVLLSNYFEESQRNRLKQMQINHYFKEYYGESKIKPYKESYYLAKGKYDPSECIMIGDHMDLDYNIPKQLGFHAILISPANHQNKSTIKEISDLTKIL